MISGICIYGKNGTLILSKIYKNDIDENYFDHFKLFIHNYNQNNHELCDKMKSPFYSVDSKSFIHLKMHHIWLCAISNDKNNFLVILEFLEKLKKILNENFFVKNYEKEKSTNLTMEKIITDNLYFINEILDDVIDFGFPIDFKLESLKDSYLFKMKDNDYFSNILSRMVSKKKNLINIDNWNMNPVLNCFSSNKNTFNFESNEKIQLFYSIKSNQYEIIVNGISKFIKKSSKNEMFILKFKANEFLNSKANKIFSLKNFNFHSSVDHSEFEQKNKLTLQLSSKITEIMRYNFKFQDDFLFKIVIKSEKTNLNEYTFVLTFKLNVMNVKKFKLEIPVEVIGDFFLNSTAGTHNFSSKDKTITWSFDKIKGTSPNFLFIKKENNYFSKKLLQNAADQKILSFPLKILFSYDLICCFDLTTEFHDSNNITPTHKSKIDYKSYSTGIYHIDY